MKIIFKCEFGSTLYGTNLPSSDKDFKSIFIPNIKDILLQRVSKSINLTTKENKNSKNTSNDIDEESFSLQQYLELLLQGQTCALEMLFCPDQFVIQTDWVWNQIKTNKPHFLHNGVTAFSSYAKNQAAKYGIKGTRVAAMRNILETLKVCPNHHVKLKELQFLANGELPQDEYTKIVMCKGPHGKAEPHLEVCNRKVSFNATVKYAIDIFQRIFDEYGARALAAEQNNGVDWKALMHAVRVCNQAKELLSTGNIEFPRPEAATLLQIRKGELPYKQVAEMIENGLEELEKIKLNSVLNSEPNRDVAENIILTAYINAVQENYL